MKKYPKRTNENVEHAQKMRSEIEKKRTEMFDEKGKITQSGTNEMFNIIKLVGEFLYVDYECLQKKHLGWCHSYYMEASADLNQFID